MLEWVFLKIIFLWTMWYFSWFGNKSAKRDIARVIPLLRKFQQNLLFNNK